MLEVRIWLAVGDDKWERRLALVVGDEEIVAGGEAGPGTAGRGAAEENVKIYFHEIFS